MHTFIRYIIRKTRETSENLISRATDCASDSKILDVLVFLGII